MKGKSKECVSIIMSVYNGEKYLSRAVESILSQTYDNLEFIIIEDCSTDGSFNILENYKKRDKRIVIIRNNENIGLTKSLNKGLEICNGTLIARQDADDFSHPERIECQVDFMDRHPDIALVGTGGVSMDEAGNVLNTERIMCGTKRLKRTLIKQNRFFHGSVVLRRECLNVVGRYHNEFVFAQDYDLFLRISERYEIENLPRHLYFHRIDPDAISSKRTSEQQIAGMVARAAARLRRKGLLREWSTEAYRDIEKSLDNVYLNRLIEGTIKKEEGRYLLLRGFKKDALLCFLKSFILFPNPRLLYQIIKMSFL